MHRTLWFSHPIFIFVLSILALAASLFLYIYWYIEVSAGLHAVVKKFNLDSRQVLEPQTWVVVMVLSILVGIILLGIFTIFVYNQKTVRLYRLQHNFINNFTHELKTPVTSLKLFLETFLKHEFSRNDRDKYIDYMLQDVNRLSENINRILNLAKIESKSYEAEFVNSDLTDVIKQFIKSNHRLLEICEINIKNPLAGQCCYAIDRPLFEMLLMNLMTNAIKYNQSDKPRIDITYKTDRGKLYIRFADNGMGIEKSELRKIFRKFYQIGRADDMTAKGSGLGLYLTQNIARIHKGKMTATSPGSGHGSIFTLRLPYKMTDN
ncbi:HAMP domain-containing sensor histidine kinase [Desulfococcaceae bacterium HSG7]|nr:HAMP domain-containing sensor histidine kinase [Desulfococcaceae bacterium HSG7]